MKLREHIINRLFRLPFILHAQVIKPKGKPRTTLLFLHGIGNSSLVWDSLIEKLPSDLRIVNIDLLGFGQSPKPSWVTYSARVQARSVMMTYLRLRIRGKVIIVGHSLGALVAVEIAKRYPLLIRSLILCSPPFYLPATEAGKRLPNTEAALRRIYRTIHNHPERFMKILQPAIKYKLVNDTFDVNQENIHSYVEALEAAIINQTSYNDAKKLQVPTTILYGTLDPVVRGRTLRLLARQNDTITLKKLLVGHEVKGTYPKSVIQTITQHIATHRKNAN